MYKIGDTFTDGGLTYEVIGIHELGYAISRRIENKPITESTEKPTYTKTQINRMSTSDLEKLCVELGVEVGSGTEMKKSLIEFLGL